MAFLFGADGAGANGVVSSVGAGAMPWWPTLAEYAWDAVKQNYIKGGQKVDQATALSFARASAARKTDGTIAAINAMRQEAAGVLYEPAGDNLISTAVFTGAVVGNLASGGSIPSPWQFSNNSFIREVISKSKDKIRIRMARTGGAPSGTSTTFRSGTFNAFPVVTGPVAASFKVTLISFSGAFLNVTGIIQEQDSSNVQVGNTNGTALTTAGQSVSDVLWRNIPNGNKVSLNIVCNLSNSTADFEVVLELETPQLELASSAIASSWMNTEDVTDPRSVDVATALVPSNGSKIVGSFYELGGGYWDAVTISGNAQAITARGSRGNRLRSAIILPGGATVDQRAFAAERIAPPTFAEATGNKTISGQSYSQHKPTGFPLAITLASNKNDRYLFETKPGQYWSGDTGNDRHRAEYSGPPLAFDTDVWWSDWFRLKSVDWDAVSGWLILGQIHASPDAGDFGASPIFAYEFTRNGMTIVTRTAATGPTSNPSSTTRYTMPGFQMGRWYRRVVRTKLNNAGAGELDVYFDGTQVVNLTGISNCYPDVVAPYMKFGIYSGPAMPAGSKSTIAEYARVEIGTASLAARIATPLDLI